MVSAHRPARFAEALRIRAEAEVTPFAGGTDLMVRWHRNSGLAPRFERPVLLLAHLPELHVIANIRSSLSIGAAVTLSELLLDARVPTVLREAAAQMASPAIRNVATLGGNICNASPAADTLPPLYCLNAELVLAAKWGERRVPIERFIVGPGKTELRQDELLKSIELPPASFDVSFYRKVGTRKANALSKLSFLGLSSLTDNRTLDVRIAFGAVAPTVVRSTRVESLLRIVTDVEMPSIRPQIIESYADLIVPIDDQRSSADYRKTVALNLLSDFLEACCGRRA